MFLDDEFFHHENTPMTKQEIRAIILSKLKLKETEIFWDIGAGSGAISIEASYFCKKVYAIEKEKERINTIKINIQKADRKNIEIIHGIAPDALKFLSKPDKVFVGGSDNNTESVLECIENILPKRITISAITLETLYTTIKFFKHYNSEIIQVGITKIKKGKKHMFLSNNPIFLITFWR
ncbi:precorrin-6Y C5,15-methyltransferase [Thermosipho melanesiensis]|uniref:Precorrin-6Y C5,15-methyltransferase (Decarboxylating), CbiT subunit n=2 Tax=Thermosipho melanesiensis TaxID=46541 RepID=A6LKW3_THEM4|nr:precorrin-6Y C5,15-methyltransferase (decarboxylating) subunit CbiT [Thermosipho melanesiensis]ABR30564.1 precorrin-6Y C5,15-methyltransferase (decarboxylating), CbiT subunit [Thermosipho melanesiensis BI429]APT73712.1 precorrin-6Y C5,15-methyltransferase [Thermosipho melanesiensis]OOC35651.1 precorrin-6Y C5,15-methyltransferase [Thermosipho melanesiensis]OOC38950.1 precorrin-6Y C5,15-methyltransferase [Thermosipho melanesiensis]OOC39098.1 precorrin-6Y C5,15-methyltransferase [Thermosipho m